MPRDTNTIIGEQTKALLDMGYIRKHDTIMTLLALLAIGVAIVLVAIGQMVAALISVISALILFQVLCIVLVYRAMWFILVTVLPAIHGVTEEAARKTVSFITQAGNK